MSYVRSEQDTDTSSQATEARASARQSLLAIIHGILGFVVAVSIADLGLFVAGSLVTWAGGFPSSSPVLLTYTIGYWFLTLLAVIPSMGTVAVYVAVAGAVGARLNRDVAASLSVSAVVLTWIFILGLLGFFGAVLVPAFPAWIAGAVAGSNSMVRAASGDRANLAKFPSLRPAVKAGAIAIAFESAFVIFVALSIA